MKKITLFFIMLGFFLSSSAQYDFNAIVGPTNVAQGSPVTLNLNDIANSAGVPVSSTGSYSSFSISADWVAGGGGPWSEEADLTVATTAGSVLIDPPTSGGAGSGANATITFEGDLPAIYEPTIDGFLEITLSQSWGGSDADWSNIVVTLIESPTCPAPTGMTTSTLTTTAADLTWSAGASETAWNVEYNAGADFTPGNGESIGSVNVSGTPATSISGLTEFTSYFVYYQADCQGADGTSEWVGPFSFITGYCESVPSSNDDQGITEVQLGSETFTSGGDITYEDFTGVTVDLAAEVTANMQVTFATGWTYDVNIWIDFNNDLVYDNATELVFQGETTNANPTTFDASFIIPATPQGIYNMRMGSADSGQATPNPCYNGSFGVTADFTINVTQAPACVPPFALNATNITENAADLVWDGGTTGVSWDLEWGPSGFTPGTGTPVNGLTATSLSLSGLSPGTAYDFYVLSNCASESSTLSGPFTFFTATPGETCANAFPMTVNADCDAATPITFNFANSADIDANGENPSCDGFGNFGYWISFTAPAIGSVVFNFDGAADNIGIEVFDACGGTAVSDCINNTIDAGGNSGIIGGLTPGDTYFAVIWRDGQSGTADVCIEEGPTCPFPINLDAANITESSTDLVWQENGTATSWNIEWGAAGFTQGSGTSINGVTTNPYNLTGLTENTEYEFYVQAICSGSTSDFSGPFSFTTTPQSNYTIDCVNDGPLNIDYCYENGGANNPFIYTFSSNDGTPLNLIFNSGSVENNFDELVVLDSDGTPFPGFAIEDDNYGAAGDIGGLTFQSTGDTISFFINSDGSVSCGAGSAGQAAGINFTVSCATCINPQATYSVIDDCDNGDQFLIDVDVTSLGDASSLTISNNIDAATTPVPQEGVYQIGPFPFLVDVVVTISNDQDANCIISSQPIQLLACPPVNDNPCEATVAVVNDDILCGTSTPGTITAATPTGVANPSCGGSADDDVWFQFVAQNESHLIAFTNITGSSTTDLDHSVYEGTCDGLTEISCTSDFAELSSVTTGLTIGETYFIRVYSGDTDAEDTSFDLCITPYFAPSNIQCDVAANFCSGSEVSDILYSYNTINLIPGEGSIDCLGSTPNPTYSTLEIGTSGDILIEMVQNSAFDSNDNPIGDELDVDFILWGPYAPGDDLCNLGAVVDCSFSAAPVENVTLLGAQQGEIYLLLITNFEREPGVIQVRQTNIGDTGSGSTIADISAEITSNEVLFTDSDSDPSTPVEANACGFPSVTLETLSPFADEFEWFKDGIVMTGETSSTLVVTESNNYQVRAIDNQCSSDALSQIVVVNLYNDPAGLIGDQNLTVCDGLEEDGVADFDLEAFSETLGLEGFAISYYTNEADAFQAINPVSSPYTTSGEILFLRIDDVAAVANNFIGCSEVVDLELVVNPIPPVNQPIDFIVCDDIDGNVDGVTDFDLTSIDGEITVDTNVAITYHTSEDDAINAASALTTPYSSEGETIFVRAEDTTTGCFNITSFNIGVNVVPLAAFDSEADYAVCPNATVPIAIEITPSNFTSSEVSVAWFLDDSPIPGSDLILDTVLVAGEYSAEITFNDSGCVNTVTTSVRELEACIFPEGISPGVSPGQNDNFDLSSFDVTKLEIFNRYGTLVYSKTNYIDEWQGQTNDGKELPVGTYFYTVIYEGGAKKRSAWVYINR